MLVGITSNILQYKPDLSKQEGYVINLESDNFKSNLYHTVNIVDLENSNYLSGCLYMDVDDA